MRYIELSEEARKALTEIYCSHAKSHVRRRAQCLLLSAQGYSVPELSDIFSTRTHTVREWFNRWEDKGVSGLEILPGRGLKPAIREENAEPVSSIRKEVRSDPRNLSSVVEKLNAQWGLHLSVSQLQSFLKKS